MQKKYFIAGTDTSAGKTFVTVGLLDALNQMGLRTVALKPIASGSEMLATTLKNDDAVALQQSASIRLPYELVNPFAFQPAIAPSIAAQQIGLKLSAEQIVKACMPAYNMQSDVILIEGVGGWSVPLNEKQTMADFVKILDLPVILVVAIRLGCLNHAILTYQSIIEKGLGVCAWVANCLSPDMDMIEQNIQSLQQWIDAPLLAQIGYQCDPSHCFNHNVIEQLMDIY